MATLINGNGNLAIYAQQDADWYAALMGGQTVITAVGNQFAYELLDANTIGVKDGVIITTEGRRIQLDANAIDSFDIPTGAQGTTNYYIIGYHLVTGDLSEQTCETFVQLMENGTDTIPEGSFRDGDDEVFVSLYRVEQNDLTLGTITLLLPQLSGSFQSQITELNNDLIDVRRNGAMPNLDYANPLFTFDSTHLSYTPTKECYLFGSIWTQAAATPIRLSIRGHEVAHSALFQSSNGAVDAYIPPLKLNVGDTVSLNAIGYSTLYVLDTISN